MTPHKLPEAWSCRCKAGLVVEAVFYDGHWCGYVYVPIDKGNPEAAESVWLLPDLDEQSGVYMYHTSKSDILADCPCHGGVSFYQKFFSTMSRKPQPPESRILRVGWDYNHYGDEWQTFTLESVIADAERVADYFIEALGLDVA